MFAYLKRGKTVQGNKHIHHSNSRRVFQNVRANFQYLMKQTPPASILPDRKDMFLVKVFPNRLRGIYNQSGCTLSCCHCRGAASSHQTYVVGRCEQQTHEIVHQLDTLQRLRF